MKYIELLLQQQNVRKYENFPQNGVRFQYFFIINEFYIERFNVFFKK